MPCTDQRLAFAVNSAAQQQDEGMGMLLQGVDSDPNGTHPLLRSVFSPSDDPGYREASFARSQDSMTQPPIYSRLAGQSVSGK